MSKIKNELINIESEQESDEDFCEDCESCDCDDTIENWHIVENPRVAISLWRFNNEESYTGYIYNVVINIFIQEEPLKEISTVTKVYNEEPLSAIRDGATGILCLYEDILDYVLVIDGETGDPGDEEYTISEAFDDLIENEDSE